jgi:hypothetical protein
MTFRSSARSNVNRYIQAGNAAASAGVEISGGIAANRPRFDKIEDARMQVHADLFEAAIDADAKVAKAGMSIKAAREQRKAKEQAEKKIRASNKSAAMAGKLAAGAQAIGLSQYVKNQKQEENPLYAYFDQTQSRIDSQASADATKQGEGDTRLEDITRQIEVLKGGKSSKTDTTASTVDLDNTTNTVALATPKPGSSVGSVAVPSSRKDAFDEIYSIASKVGGTKFPEVVAAQAMHETGWLSAPNSVYKATGETNPFGQTGDRGFGTIPREGFKDGWTLYPDKETAVRDHISLWHSTSNHPGNYNAFDSIKEGVASVAPAYSPNADPENIKRGYTVDGYSKGVKSALEEMGFTF